MTPTLRTQTASPLRLLRAVLDAMRSAYWLYRAKGCDSDAKHHDEAAQYHLTEEVRSRRFAAHFRRRARR